MLASERYIDVIEAYEKLQACLQNLKHCLLADSSLMAWLQDGPSSYFSQLSHRERAYAVLSALEYEDTQAPKEIIICAGIIASSYETLRMVEALNEAKHHFKRMVLMLKKEKLKLNDKTFVTALESTLSKREGGTSTALKKMGLARLHLKQCYRSIPVLTEAPLKITWTWAHTRSIRKISKEQAKALLSKRAQDMGIEYQLRNLESLSHLEPLALVQELAPHLRANILFTDQKRLMIKGPIPIFYPATTSISPIFKPPTQKKAKNKDRMIRADLQIDPEPFLPAIHAHRYLAFSKK
ncbi:MAG: DNA replication terminus site-binding family protein [Gammaproteobacteria bacterium]